MCVCIRKQREYTTQLALFRKKIKKRIVFFRTERNVTNLIQHKIYIHLSKISRYQILMLMKLINTIFERSAFLSRRSLRYFSLEGTNSTNGATRARTRPSLIHAELAEGISAAYSRGRYKFIRMTKWGPISRQPNAGSNRKPARIFSFACLRWWLVFIVRQKFAATTQGSVNVNGAKRAKGGDTRG